MIERNSSSNDEKRQSKIWNYGGKWWRGVADSLQNKETLGINLLKNRELVDPLKIKYLHENRDW